MAIDTALKRGSAVHVMMPWRSMLPVPDSTIDQADRQVVPFMYSGILAGVIVPATGLVYEADLDVMTRFSGDLDTMIIASFDLSST